jgi:O-antigen/teichoic acid export membrane protein
MERLKRSLRQIRELLAHPLAGGARDLILAQVYTGFLRIATAALAARLLGPAGYGSAALAIAYPTLIWTFVGVKSGAVTTRYMTNHWERDERDELGGMARLGYSVDAATAIIAAGLTTVSLFISTFGIGSVDRRPLAIALAVSLPFYSLIGTTTAVFTSLTLFRHVAGLQAAEATVTLLLVGPALVWRAEPSSLVFATAIALASTGVVSFLWANKVLRDRRASVWKKDPQAETPRLGGTLIGLFGWNYLAVTLNGMLVHLPLLLLGRVGATRDAGYLRAASSVVAAGSYAESSMGRVAYPVLASRWRSGGFARVQATIRSWTLRAGVPVAAALLGAALALPFLIPFVFGDGYRPMVAGSQILMVGVAVSAGFFYVIQVYYATGRIDAWAKGLSIYVPLVLIAMVPAADRSGFLGVAVVTAVGTALWNLVMAYRMRRVLEGSEGHVDPKETRA